VTHPAAETSMRRFTARCGEDEFKLSAGRAGGLVVEWRLLCWIFVSGVKIALELLSVAMEQKRVR
jgi:hypothetical protein